jgi:hypothetical protein
MQNDNFRGLGSVICGRKRVMQAKWCLANLTPIVRSVEEGRNAYPRG